MTYTLKKIVGYTLAIFLGFFLLYGFYKAFTHEQGVVEGLKKYVIPTTKFGQDKLQGTKPTVPEQQETEIKAFQKTLMDLLANGNKNCFVQHQGFSDLPQGVKIEMTRFPERTSVKISKIPGKGENAQTVTDLNFDIPNMIPCVVAGEDGDGKLFANGFYKNYLANGGTKKQIYKEVTTVVIEYNTDGFNENRIKFDSSPFIDFEGYQWLYKPFDNYICFFPTYDDKTAILFDKIITPGDACDGDSEDGLDDDCFTDVDEAENIENRIRDGTLPLCYGELILEEETAQQPPTPYEGARPLPGGSGAETSG